MHSIVPRVAPNIELAHRVNLAEIVVKIKPLTLEEERGIVTGYSYNLTKCINHCVVVDMNYYSKHGASEREHFQIVNNHSYGKGMTAQEEGHPSVSSDDS